jgi:transcription antitermination factor NusG
MSTAEMPVKEQFESTVNVTDERVAHPKHWVAALVQIRSEKTVSKKLHSLGIANYVPIQSEIHKWSDRRKKVDRVVIPMIVFIHAEMEEIKKLVYHSFIHKLLTYPGQKTPAIIPDSQIDNLKFMLGQSETSVEMRDHVFKTGDRVRIIRGPLKGIEGELCKVENGKTMVSVQIDCLGYACVNVDVGDVQLLNNQNINI